MPYSKLSDIQLEELMKGKLLTFPNLTIEKNEILFHSDDCENIIKNKLRIPEIFYKLNTDHIFDNLFIHMKISPVSYCTEDLTALINNCKIKPKVIDLSETKLR